VRCERHQHDGVRSADGKVGSRGRGVRASTASRSTCGFGCPGFDALSRSYVRWWAQRSAAVISLPTRRTRTAPARASQPRDIELSSSADERTRSEIEPPRPVRVAVGMRVSSDRGEKTMPVLEKRRLRCSTAGDGTRPAGVGKSEEVPGWPRCCRASWKTDGTRRRAEGCPALTGAIREKLLKMLASLTDLVRDSRGAVAQEMAMLDRSESARSSSGCAPTSTSGLWGRGRPSAR